ncbi:MAG TPA: hypothetical protein PLB41_06845 [Rubrivivax sp.]|nr:hypothetical protein [Rubrivivax sp.]
MTLPIGTKQLTGSPAPIDFLGGRPVRARLTMSRDPVNAPDAMRLLLAFDGQGDNGLLAVRATESGVAHSFNVAAGMATALIASGKAGDGTLAVLAGAGEAASALFKPQSEFVLKGVELASSGHGAPVGNTLRFALDYSVALRVKQIGIDGLGVSMVDNQPMRFRVRKVALTYGDGGVSGFKLDYDGAELEVENPGAWQLEGLDRLKDLFDVIGSRTGRGSMWIEVDLRFKLNLGPIRVSGLTIRVTDNGAGAPKVSVTRMLASLSIPGAFSGEGEVQVGGKEEGFSAHLCVRIDPLNVVADALVIYRPPMTVLGLGVDLPAPIPLANSGLGLFGLAGLFAANGVPAYDPGIADPVAQKLAWTPDGPESFAKRSGSSAFGLGAVIGTLPDMGFAFSAKASLLITVPDVMVRAGLNARALAPRVSIATKQEEAGFGFSAKGMLSIDGDAVDFAVIGKAELPPLLKVVVPVAGHFDRKDSSQWYIYLGADGAPIQGRQIGPVSLKVLPNILDIGADAYLMMRGSGLTDWPHGRSVPNGPWSVADGFVVAFGFSVHSTFGPKPIAYAELNASLDLLLGTAPPTMAGFGSACGSLHLGPFSIGVQASIAFRKQEQLEYLWAEVVARIELLFTEIEGRVTISHGDGKAPVAIPEPDGHPLELRDADNVVVGTTPALTDDTYRLLAYLAESPAAAPVVWPDVIVSLPFGVMPAVAPGSTAQFPAAGSPSVGPPQEVGAEMLHYVWTLDRLALLDITDAADPISPTAGTVVAGKLAAAWQAPRAGSMTLSELVLGSHGQALFARRLADGGKSLDNQPTDADARYCELRVEPEAGWAVGVKAVCAVSGTRVPAESVSRRLTFSLVQATARHYAEGQAINPATGYPRRLDMDGGAPVPAPHRVSRAMVHVWNGRAVVAFPPPFEMKHEFGGHYWPPNLTHDQDDASFSTQVVELTLDQPIRAAQLLLLVPAELRLWVTSPGDVAWDYQRGEASGLKSPGGEPMYFFVAQLARADVFVDRIFVRRTVARTGDPGARTGAIGIVGLRGVTASADAAAGAINQGTKDKNIALEDQVVNQHKPGFKWEGQYLRTILEPGRLYRLDVDLSWTGSASEQQADGSRAVVNTATGKKPKQFFFRTAPKPDAPARPPSKAVLPSWLRSVDPPSGAPDADSIRANRTKSVAFATRPDRFDGALVERYFGGYTPAQSEQFRFTKDPIDAHFTQDHVVALVKAYGFDLDLAIRRVDRVGPAYDGPLALSMTYRPLEKPSVLSTAQRIVYDAISASPCVQPKPGMTGRAQADLEPSAWYELCVRVTEAAGLMGVREVDRFRGVTFRTSRWTDPKAMLQDVLTGTGPATRPYLHGDLLVDDGRIAELRAANIVRDDRAFDAAALALGADGWPAAEDPRTSALWVRAPNSSENFLFVGLMVESPEPLERDQRVALSSNVDLDMGPRLSRAGALRLARSDRSGHRLLFIADAPIQVITAEFLPGPMGLGRRRHAISPAVIFHAQGSTEGAFDQRFALKVLPAFAEVNA